jgi:hypothetical protein
MIGEISIGGVFIPSLIVLVLVATVLTAMFSQLLSWVGFYRLVANRPLADIAVFLLLLGAVVWLTAGWGLHA